jgi:hypothetical protein
MAASAPLAVRKLELNKSILTEAQQLAETHEIDCRGYWTDKCNRLHAAGINASGKDGARLAASRERLAPSERWEDYL